MGDSNSRPDGPKPPALPTALIPDFWVFSFALTVVKHVVRQFFFDHLDLRGECLYRRRIKGLRSRYFPAWKGGILLPNQARYQLRYTRILNDLMGMDLPEATRRRALHTIPVHYNTPAAKREAYSYPFFFDGKTLTWHYQKWEYNIFIK